LAQYIGYFTLRQYSTNIVGQCWANIGQQYWTNIGKTCLQYWVNIGYNIGPILATQYWLLYASTIFHQYCWPPTLANNVGQC